MSSSLTLSKKERLKSYRKIRLLFDAGERFRQHPFLVYYTLSTSDVTVADDEVLQMGVSVGTRNFKKAVTRNLLKRRTREAYRKNKPELKEALQTKGYLMSVFFVYTHSQITDYKEIELAIKTAIIKLITRASSWQAQRLNYSTNKQIPGND